MDVRRGPDWYDSVWLAAYQAAVATVARVAPQRLDEFEHSFDVLRTRPDFSTRSLPGLLGPAELEELLDVVRAIPREKLELHEMRRFGRFVVHDLPEFTSLQQRYTERASEWAGEPLAPSYNFLSFYTHLGECRPHLDSPESKWTLDICLRQDTAWPIYLSKVVPWPDAASAGGTDWYSSIRTDPALEFERHMLEPGDAVFFSGASQWHYRDVMPDDGQKHFCDLLFMHFIPRGTEELVAPRNWARLFDMPELAAIGAADEAA